MSHSLRLARICHMVASSQQRACDGFGLALAVSVLAVACTSSGDNANVSISLGRATTQALAIDGVTVRHFELEVTCIDGRSDTVRGDVDDDGNFTADVLRCQSATILFRGLTEEDNPALLGTTTSPIRPPSTDLVFEVIRVGTVTFENDAGYTSVCALTTPEAPEMATRFVLEPDASTTLVLPVVNTTLVCMPATACADVDTCELSGPLATASRTVAVPFGGTGILSLTNLTNTLRFTTALPSAVTAGAVWSPFSVELDNDAGLPIDRPDVTVSLTTTSSILNGAFTGGEEALVGGVATFDAATFATAGAVAVKATANVNGVLLETTVVTVSVAADIAAILSLTGPVTAVAGETIAVVVSAVDRFNNSAALPGILLTSDDPQTTPVRLDAATTNVQATEDSATTAVDVGGTQVAYVLYTIGAHVITAQDVDDASVFATLTVTVVGGAVTQLVLSGPAHAVANLLTSFPVSALDAGNNPVAMSAGFALALYVDGSQAETYSFVAGNTGSYTFEHQFLTPATYSVNVVGSSLASNTLTVIVDQAGTVDHLTVTPSVLTSIAGATIGVDIQAVDAAGTLVANSDSVNVYSSDPSDDGSQVSLVAGSVHVDYTFYTAGEQTIFATDGAAAGSSSPITVTASTAQQVKIITQPPANVTVGQPFAIAVTVVDAYGNAASPAAYTLSLGLSGTGTANLSGTGRTDIGTTVYYDSLVIDGAVTDATLTVTSSPAAASATSTVFQVHAPLGCPIAYVVPGGAGDKSACSVANATSTITAALDKADSDGKIYVAAGTYNESISVSDQHVIQGGFDLSFKSRTPLDTPSIIHPNKGQTYAVTVASSADVTIDGMMIQAADLLSSTSSTFAGLAQSGSVLVVRRSILVGPFCAVEGEGGVWDINDAKSAIFNDNWISTGGLLSGETAKFPRHGVRSLGGGGDVAIVSNTWILPPATSAEAVYYDGTGDWSVTDNLFIGDFTSCSSSQGVCALAEFSDSAGIGSANNNVVFETQDNGAMIYRSTKGLFSDLNSHGGNFKLNVNIIGQAAGTILVELSGKDGHLYTMADNDWHLISAGSLAVGTLNTATTCGATGQSSCGGDGKDIDGELFDAKTPVVGADEPGTAVR